MEYVSWFILDYIVIFILYYFLNIRRCKRDKKMPSEISYLVNFYKLDIKKFSYKKFVTIVGLVVALDVAIVATFVPIIDGIVWQILFGFVFIIPVVVISFISLGNYYKKKQTKDNSEELKKEKKYLDKLEKKEEKKNTKKKGRKKNVK